jgi:hypothetical protein
MHFLRSRSLRVALVLFAASCLYVPWRDEALRCPEACARYYRRGYDFLFSSTAIGTVDLSRWGLEVLGLAALVALSYSWERRS